MGEWINGVKRAIGAFVGISGDVNSVAWTDYSGISTIVGWSSYTDKEILYKKVGNLVFVSYFIKGTSNNTATSFTLPFSTDAAETQAATLYWLQDSGTSKTGVRLFAAPPSNVISFYTSINFHGWVASGSKQIQGKLWYET